MAVGAFGVFAVEVELLAEGEAIGLGVISWELPGVGWRWGGGVAEHGVENPDSSMDGAGAEGERSGGESATHAEDSTTVFVMERDFAEFASGDGFFEPVVARESGVGEGVVAVDELGEGAVLANEVGEEFDAFVIHRAAEFGGEGGEAFGVGIGMLDHFFEFEPTSGEVSCEGGKLRARDHAKSLCVEDLGLAELAFVGEFEELAVGHGGPEEVG